ncbi:MAG: hypothetical protein HW421_411 [Ignavibacteria bacterium]|nr:hypothetical protein [Ignavibacteria bacterium]
MKKLLLSISMVFCLVLIGLIFTFYYYDNFSERAKKAKINLTNSKKIYLGMKKDDVINCLGKPDDIFVDKKL